MGRRSSITWRLSEPGLRRIADVLVESVRQGNEQDRGLRDQALEQVRCLVNDRAARRPLTAARLQAKGADCTQVPPS